MSTTTATRVEARAPEGRPGNGAGPRPASPPLVAARAEPALLRLLQLTSSLCPIGAFAYSQGLETAVERGWVRDEASLADWVGGVGEHALGWLDLPLLGRAHEASAAADVPRLESLGERLLASREARELAEQERQLGRALASVLSNLGVGAAAPFRDHASASYVVCFALGAQSFGVGLEAAMLGYAFAWCEQQVSAASRVVPLGHMAAQRALSRVLEGVPAWLTRAAALPDDQLGSSTPGLAMAAAWHETQYTRLFRS